MLQQEDVRSRLAALFVDGETKKSEEHSKQMANDATSAAGNDADGGGACGGDGGGDGGKEIEVVSEHRRDASVEIKFSSGKRKSKTKEIYSLTHNPLTTAKNSKQEIVADRSPHTHTDTEKTSTTISGRH